MYVWLVIFVVPINALVNPLLYTFTTPKYITTITSKNVFMMTYRDSNIGKHLQYLNLNDLKLIIVYYPTIHLIGCYNFVGFCASIHAQT